MIRLVVILPPLGVILTVLPKIAHLLASHAATLPQ